MMGEGKNKSQLASAKLVPLVLAVALLYWECFRYWGHTWVNDRDYYFAWMIPVLVSYGIWKKRAFIASAPLSPSRLGALPILAAMALYLLGQVSYTQAAVQLSFFVLLPGVILFLFGFVVLRRLLIPILLLIFMTPFVIPFSPLLQGLAAKVSWFILTTLGFPAYIDGNLIDLPNLRTEVASGCVGFRYAFALIPIGITVAYTSGHTRFIKIGIIIFSAVLSVLASVFRITSILVLASMGNEILVSGSAHYIHGYLVFLGVLVVLLSGLYLLDKLALRSQINSEEKQVRAVPGGGWANGLSGSRVFILVLFLVLFPTLLHFQLGNQRGVPVQKDFESFPLALGEWRGHALGGNEWHPRVNGETRNLFRVYRSANGEEIRVFVLYMPRQSQGSELVYHANEVVPGRFHRKDEDSKAWTIGSKSGSGRLQTQFRRNLQSAGDEYFLCWYQIGKWFARRGSVAKGLTALRSLIRNRSDGALIVMIFKTSLQNQEQSEKKINEFLDTFVNTISAYLPS